MGQSFIPLTVLLGALLVVHSAGADVPAGNGVKTGELDLTFTQRNPNSARKEIARRLNLKESALGADYDLSTRPFKAYVPPSYDPSIPHGVIVYLGYKDSEALPTPWEPALDKAHLIFITPVCHHGKEYPNEVPRWQTMGLAFDAIENLKQQYNIDPHRLYLMSFSEGSIQMSLASSDLFTGMISVFDIAYFRSRIERGYQPIPADFPPPPGNLLQQAKRRGVVLVNVNFTEPHGVLTITLREMKADGFNVLAQVGDTEDVHYPNLKREWFEDKALPFLDKVAQANAVEHVAAHSPASGTAGATTRPAAAAGASQEGNPEAARLLRLAQIYIGNGQPKMARPKLQSILELYPKDPAAGTARELLAKLPPEPAPDN